MFNDPALVESFANSFLIVCTGLTGILAAVVGWNKVSKPKDIPTGGLQVAGALVSDAQAKNIVAALEANTIAMGHNTQAAQGTAKSIVDIEHELRQLTLELRLSARRG